MTVHLAATGKNLPARLPWWLAGCLILAVTIAAGLAPYEVDYEVTLLPWLISKGWVLYRDIADQHPPLLPTLLAAGGGDPGPVLHALVAGQHLLLVGLTCVLAGRLLGGTAALLSVALTEVWSVALDSGRLWYDSVLGILYLGLFLLFTWEAPGPGDTCEGQIARRAYSRFFWLGLLAALALLVKQQALPAVAFLIPAIIVSSGHTWRRALGVFFVGMVVPLAIATALLMLAGALGQAWYWIVLYSLTGNYASAAAQAPSPGDWWTLTAFLLPVVALALVGDRMVGRRYASSILAFTGLLIAAVLPAWPRYGGFHLQGAAPLLSILGVVALWRAVALLRENRGLRRALAAGAVGVLSVFAVAGVREWLSAVQLFLFIGPPTPPYSASISPLKQWVDRQAQGRPVFIYGLDPLLYRVLEVQPPRPWAPQLPWILAANRTEDELWAGVETARPGVVLAPAGAWDSTPSPGPEYGVPRLRQEYHEARRFRVASSRLTPSVEIVGLLSSESSAHLERIEK